MKKNMGSTDKVIRILIALVIGVLYYTKIIEGTVALVLGALAIYLQVLLVFAHCICLLAFQPIGKNNYGGRTML